MSTNTDLILAEERLDGRILLLTINRPDAANGIDDDLALALEKQIERIKQSPVIEAVILTGTGRIFCSGGDVGAFKSALTTGEGAGELPALLERLSTRIHASLEALVNAGPLLIAAVNGPATGAGLGLVCATDIAYGRAGAVLRPGFSRLGLSPDTGTTHFLPRVVGYRKALEILTRGDAISAEQALSLGLFAELIDADGADFVAQVIARTTALIASGAAALATRRLLRQSEAADLHAQLEREKASLIGLAASPAVVSGLRKVLGIS